MASNELMSSAMERARRIIQNDAKKDAKVIMERAADRNKMLNQTVKASEFDNLMPSYSSNQPQIINEDHGTHGEYLDNQIESRMQALRESVKSQGQRRIETPKNVMPNSKSKLPKEILESFATNQIDYSKLSNDSVLDFVDIQPMEQREVIQEEYEGASQPSINTGVDYSLIKDIVESTVKKYMGAYTKKIISESKNNNSLSDLKAIKMGDTFSFITENGDVFEAKLTFKRNIHEGKK
jgi:hypothetical protein